MKNIIIIEYFTSSPDITQNFHKNIYNEGLKICDSISLNLKQRTKTSNIVVLRNEKFKIPKNSKVLYKRTSEKISFLKHLSDFDSKDTNIIHLEMSIVNKVGLNVEIKNKKNNKGKISFEYKNLDQLNKIIDIVKKYY